MAAAGIEVVVGGSFRRDPDQLLTDYETLLDAGAHILSPGSLDFTSYDDAFARTKQEEGEPAWLIESKHLAAIVQCELMWLHLPAGHLGSSAAVELGLAHSLGVPTYCRHLPGEVGLDWMLIEVASPLQALDHFHEHGEQPGGPGLRRLQNYYRRASERRKWSREGAEETIGRLRSEINEFEQAASTRERRLELADIFLYATHLANISELDASEAVVEKEQINKKRFE